MRPLSRYPTNEFSLHIFFSSFFALSPLWDIKSLNSLALSLEGWTVYNYSLSVHSHQCFAYSAVFVWLSLCVSEYAAPLRDLVDELERGGSTFLCSKTDAQYKLYWLTKRNLEFQLIGVKGYVSPHFGLGERQSNINKAQTSARKDKRRARLPCQDQYKLSLFFCLSCNKTTE